MGTRSVVRGVEEWASVRQSCTYDSHELVDTAFPMDTSDVSLVSVHVT